MTVIQSRMAAGFWGGARGWNADQFGRPLSPPLVRPLRGCGTRVVGWVRFVGTLLGPERAGHPCGGVLCSCVRAVLSVVPPSPCGVRRVWRGSGGGVWLYVENCTVD